MLNNKITKNIIEKVIMITPNTKDVILNFDVEIIIKNQIIINVFITIKNSISNLIEVMKIFQKNIYFELEDKTDEKNYVINIIIK